MFFTFSDLPGYLFILSLSIMLQYNPSIKPRFSSIRYFPVPMEHKIDLGNATVAKKPVCAFYHDKRRLFSLDPDLGLSCVAFKFEQLLKHQYRLRTDFIALAIESCTKSNFRF